MCTYWNLEYIGNLRYFDIYFSLFSGLDWLENQKVEILSDEIQTF